MPRSTDKLSNPDFTSQLNIESLIAAPLIAASKANVVMITGQTRTILEKCFARNEQGHYEPILINMTLTQTSVTADMQGTASISSEGRRHRLQVAKIVFSVPLITIVPISNLVVDKVDVDFDLEITSVYHKPSTSNLADTKPINERKAVLHGRIADRSRVGSEEERRGARLKVSIHAGPLPLPLGILSILDLYSKSIQPHPKT
jgi:hypothetical protein